MVRRSWLSSSLTMSSCFRLSLLEWKEKRSHSYFRRHGLRSQLIQIHDALTSIHCWAPSSFSHTELPKTYNESSDLPPALLLLHGFGASATIWEHQIAPLVKHFRVYVPDLIFFGHHSTTQIAEKRSEIFQAECMWKMMKEMGVEEAMVVGHSYGGFVAFRMAHMYPGFVKRLVIISSGICMAPETNQPLLHQFGATHISQILLPDSVERVRKSMGFILYRSPWLPRCVYEDLLVKMNEKRKQKLELVDAIIIGTKDAPSLPQLEQDLLIIWGAQDKIFNISLAHDLKRHTNNKAKLVIIEKVGHLPIMETPKVTNDALISFLMQHITRSCDF